MRPLAAVLAALALLVSACGGDEGGGGGTDPAALLTAAVARSDERSSARMRFDMRMTFGAEDFRSSGEMRAGVGETRAAGTMRLVAGGEEMTADVILLDGVSYVRGDQLDLPPGKTWVKAEDESLEQQSMSFEQFVDLVREADGARTVGREEIRGTPTVHISAPLDIKALMERTPDGPVTRMFEQQPELADKLSAQVDVWIAEGEDRIDRIALEMKMDGEPGKMDMTADMLEYDVSLDDIEAPPEDEVVEQQDVGAG